MLNKYPLWKNLLILFIIGLGAIYSMPNLYPQDPAVQISSAVTGQPVTEAQLKLAEKVLQDAEIDYFGTSIDGGLATLRVNSSDAQLAAKKVIERQLGSNYIVALNLVPTTPNWLVSLGGTPMKKGLDLAGGVHFLLEVDTDVAVHNQLESIRSQLRKDLRAAGARYQSEILAPDNQIIVRFADAELREKGAEVVRKNFGQFLRSDDESEGAFFLRLTMPEQAIREIIDNAMTQNLSTLRNRVDSTGVSEPLVQRQGPNRIVVELPGVQDPALVKRLLGRNANLEFRMEAKADALMSSKENFADGKYGNVWLEKDVIVTGDNVGQATAGADPQTSQPEVNLTLDSLGGTRMHEATRYNIGRRMATILVEYNPRKTYHLDENGVEVETVRQERVDKLINLATVQAALGVQFRITGLPNPAEASELARLIRSGALSAPMYFVRERTIGPSLGAENIRVGVQSMMIGMALVLVFMVLVYRVFGVIANIALAVNVLLLSAVMSLFGATLTLPGIAGIVLTVGMAVDANVLIFSRIREELKNGASPQSAINAGFERALTTIFDANVTTLIVAFILWGIGSGPVKGFAITLSIGIITSVFTATMITRAIVNFVYGGRRVQKLWI